MVGKKEEIFMALVLIVAASVGAYVTLVDPPQNLERFFTKLKSTPEVINWRLLYKYDYKTKKVPEEIQSLDGKTVKIAGYIVPLMDSYTVLNEFLLVPDAQSCIHVPPPPPNLIVWVKLERPVPANEVPYPAWVTGVFHVETSKSKYGNAAYKMIGKKLSLFRELPPE